MKKIEKRKNGNVQTVYAKDGDNVTQISIVVPAWVCVVSLLTLILLILLGIFF